MDAIRVHKYGGPHELLVEKCSVPEIEELLEILVHVKAVGVNPVDSYIREGSSQKPLPFTPGFDCAGIVEKVGGGVTKFKPGDRVFCTRETRTGCYAQYAIYEENAVFRLSDSLTFSQGAAIGIPYFTAHRALFNRAGATFGETVLVHGASGGVGVAAVQVAKAKQLQVFATAGTSEGLEFLKKELHLKHVYNHKEKHHVDEILKVTNNDGVDLILEMIASANLADDLQLVKRHGRVVVIGARGSSKVEPNLFMGKECTVTGVAILSSSSEEWEEMSKDLLALIDQGFLKPVIANEFSLAEADKAHKEVMQPHGHKGKVVLNLEMH